MNAGLLFSNIEYVTLRLIRRWMVPDALLARLARLLPDRYLASCVGLGQPAQIVARWEQAVRPFARSFDGLDILEIGAGAANATGEVLLGRNAKSWIGMDPFFAPNGEGGRLARTRSLENIPDAGIDAIVSHSVLEHVEDGQTLFAQCRRVLKPGGFMIHIVDYRDHFFKYPFHFLQFSGDAWRWLNPGDLPRWRLYDHLRQLADAGFTTSVVSRKIDDDAFAVIRPHVARDFVVDDPDVAVVEGVLFSTAR